MTFPLWRIREAFCVERGAVRRFSELRLTIPAGCSLLARNYRQQQGQQADHEESSYSLIRKSTGCTVMSTPIRIFFSSPGDLGEEREKAWLQSDVE